MATNDLDAARAAYHKRPMPSSDNLQIIKNYAAAVAYIEQLEPAYDLEKEMVQAYGDGWRTRIALGDCDGLESLEDNDRWNAAASTNPHPYNSDLYKEWRRGFLDNDFHRRFTAMSDAFGEFRLRVATQDAEIALLRVERDEALDIAESMDASLVLEGVGQDDHARLAALRARIAQREGSG